MYVLTLKRFYNLCLNIGSFYELSQLWFKLVPSLFYIKSSRDKTKCLSFKYILASGGTWKDNVVKMQNETGETVDLYIPRKCSATSNLIGAKDHASVQLSIAEVDQEGRMTGGYKNYAFCGKLRGMAEADDALNHLCLRDGIIPANYKLN